MFCPYITFLLFRNILSEYRSSAFVTADERFVAPQTLLFAWIYSMYDLHICSRDSL